MEHIPVDLDGYNAHRPMVIVHPQAKHLVKKFIRSLADSNLTVGAMVHCTLPYVNRYEIVQLAGLFRWRQCDSIIAIGGEFTMDIAKALAIFLSDETDFKSLQIHDRTIPFAYIATQDISGTEVTGTMNLDGREVASDFLYPDIVCIDNRMVGHRYGLDKTIYAALGALAWSLEGVADEQCSPFAEASAYTAISLVAGNLPKLVQKPTDKKSALAVVNGITVAGTVRSNSQGGVACLTGELLAVELGYDANLLAGLLLPIALRYKYEQGQAIQDDLLLALAGVNGYSAISAEHRSKESIRITELLASFANIKIDQLKIQQHLIQKVAAGVQRISNSRISTDYCFGFLTYVLGKRSSADK
jgi:alcohol dehydrogenase class IV